MRSNFIKYLLVVVVVLSVCSCDKKEDYYSDWTNHPFYLSQVAKLEEKTRDCKVVFVGDSRIRGGKWEQQDPDWCNYGVAGDTTYGVLNRIQTVIDKQPETVILQVGRNDIFEVERAVVDVFNDYNSIINILDGFKVVITSTLPDETKSTKIHDLNNLLKASDNFLDINETLAPNGTLTHTFDGVHFDESGFSIWYEIMKNHLTPIKE